MGANSSGEWGIFQDDGMIDGGFASQSAAQRALDLDYSEDGAHVAEVCSEHPEHEAESCDLCIAIEMSDEEDLVRQ